jgi:P2-related tail formation protein
LECESSFIAWLAAVASVEIKRGLWRGSRHREVILRTHL